MRRAEGVTTLAYCMRRKDLRSQRPSGGLKGGAGRERVGRGDKRAAEPAEPRRVPSAEGQSPGALPGRETPKLTASLTCQTLARRPEAQATPGLFCRSQSLPLPELQDPRAEDGTEAGKAATGPKPREAYIGGVGGPGRQLRASLSSPAANSASREQHRASLSPLFPGLRPKIPSKQRRGFRRPHSAP